MFGQQNNNDMNKIKWNQKRKKTVKEYLPSIKVTVIVTSLKKGKQLKIIFLPFYEEIFFINNWKGNLF